VLQRAQTAAGTPYQAYTGQQVADLNSTQNSAFNAINGAQTAYQPFLNSASGYATAGASPITSADLARYQNPYQQQVIDATMANINENNGQQRTALTGNAISQGAFGGDRAGIAQAELARQQDLSSNATLAGLNSQNYTQSLGAAQADRSAAQTGASQFSGLAGQAMSLPLQGASVQLQAGNQQQAQSQSQLNVPYQQWQQQQAYPYQQTQWLAGIDTGVGSQMGGTSSNVSTKPGPNPMNSILGAGLAAASFIPGAAPFTMAGSAALGAANASANGGRIMPFANGGSTGGVVPYGYEGGWIPKIGITAGHGLPTAQAAGFDQDNTGKTVKDAIGLAGKIKGAINNNAEPDPGSFDKPLAGLSPDDYDPAGPGVYANGGDVLAAVRDPRGGIYLPQRFADGGAPMDVMNGDPAWETPDIGPGMAPAASFADRFGSLPAAKQNLPFQDAYFDKNGISPAAFAGNPDGEPIRLDRSPKPVMAEDDSTDDGETAPKAAYAPKAGVAGTSAMSFAPTDTSAAPSRAQPPQEESFWNPTTRHALLAAGLGMMSSRSPYLGVAAGEGGLSGLSAYDTSRSNQQKAQEAADKLSLEAKKSASDLALRTQSQAETGRHNVATEKTASEKTKFIPAGSIMGDDGSLHPAVMDQYTGNVIDSVTGKPPKDSDKMTPKGARAPISDDDAKALATYYVKTGDASRLNGLGITGEARQKVQHYVVDAQKQMNVTDEELATRKTEFAGRSAGQRVLATQEAKMGSAAFEAEGAIKQARGVIEKLPRTSFLPFNQLAQGYSKNTLNPDQAELYGRTQAIVNTYSAVMARGANVTTDSARGHAEALLNTAANPEVFNRMLDTMLNEIEMAKHSPAKMREFYRDQYGAKAVTPESGGSGGSSGGQSPAASTTKPARVRQNGHEYQLGPDGNYTVVQ
jgi:hypothetical protein